jgi:arginyl-tRNA synthetase
MSLEGNKIYHMSEKDRLEKMKNFALDEIHRMQMESLKRFGVEFDNWMSEKKLREEGMVEEVLSYLTEANCTYEKDEAIWFQSTLFGDEKDRVLLRQDGTVTYFAPDIAYHLTKYNRKFDYIIDVLGPDHHGYVPRLIAALKALKYDTSKLEIIYLQHINLVQNGEIIKMSKRAGKIVTMDDLIDEVGKDAARFFFINRKPNAHLNFDLELAKKQSSDNPVYYIQYAHARIYSILKKARSQKLFLSDFDPISLKKLNKRDEIDIIKKIMILPELLINIAETREPHRLATYVHQLAGMFHKYYAKYKILGLKDKNLTLARLYLISTVKNVIALVLDLMGISAPKQM